MICKQIQKMLRDYTAGHLDEDTHKLVDQHLSECADCRSALQDEQNIAKFLRSEGPLSTGDSLASQLLQQVSELDQTKKSRLQFNPAKLPTFMKWILVTSMLALFGIIGIFVFRFKSESVYYIPTYGETGFTLMSPDNATDPLRENPDLFSQGMQWGGSLAAVAGSDLNSDSTDEESGRIVHTFDLDDESDGPIVSEFNLKEKSQ